MKFKTFIINGYSYTALFFNISIDPVRFCSFGPASLTKVRQRDWESDKKILTLDLRAEAVDTKKSRSCLPMSGKPPKDSLSDNGENIEFARQSATAWLAQTVRSAWLGKPGETQSQGSTSSIPCVRRGCCEVSVCIQQPTIPSRIDNLPVSSRIFVKLGKSICLFN